VGALVQVRGLWRIYPVGDGEVVALRDVSLDIDEGEFVAIMGSSGSGKSTLMNVLGCLDRPTRGSYRLRGRDALALSADEHAVLRNREIGFVFQTFNLIPRTSALENVELPLVYSDAPPVEQRARALTALAAVGLQGREHHMPNQLSGGQQQRVAVARALVNRPSLLLADEPTGNLDTRSGLELMATFERLRREQGVTLVVVTHEADIASLAERVVTFRDGEVVADVRQPPAQLPQEAAP
jgi:putative ABC transport system ATP-binding protein